MINLKDEVKTISDNIISFPEKVLDAYLKEQSFYIEGEKSKGAYKYNAIMREIVVKETFPNYDYVGEVYRYNENMVDFQRVPVYSIVYLDKDKHAVRTDKDLTYKAALSKLQGAYNSTLGDIERKNLDEDIADKVTLISIVDEGGNTVLDANVI